MVSRKCQQYLKVVVITSLCWCILDVWILNYFSGCANSGPQAAVKRHIPSGSATDLSEADIDAGNQDDNGDIQNSDEEVVKENVNNKKSFFDNIIPDGKVLFEWRDIHRFLMS